MAHVHSSDFMLVDKAAYASVNPAALASRAGSETLRPALQRLYMTRASAYRDALRSFVEGYQEGVGEVMRASTTLKNDVEREASSGVENSDQSNVTKPGAEETR